MKNNIFLALLVLLSLTSCEKDESLDPRPDLVPGKYVVLNVSNKYIDFNNISTSSFDATLTSPSNAIVRYELFVRRRGSNGIITSDFKLFKTITSFPFELKVTLQEIATVLNEDIATFEQGDIYQFSAYSYDVNGVRTGFLNLSNVLQSASSMKQAYKFSTILEIPATGEGYNNFAPYTDN